MAVKFPENFVAYQLDIEDRGVAAAQLEPPRHHRFQMAAAVRGLGDGFTPESRVSGKVLGATRSRLTGEFHSRYQRQRDPVHMSK